MSNEVTLRLAAIRNRLEGTTPGPWKIRADSKSWYVALETLNCRFENLVWGLVDHPDAALIVNAPEDLAWACDEIEHQAGRITEARRLGQVLMDALHHYPTCPAHPANISEDYVPEGCDCPAGSQRDILDEMMRPLYHQGSPLKGKTAKRIES